MSWKMVEPLVDAVSAYITANGAAKAAAVDHDVAVNSVTLVPPVAIYNGEVELEMVPQHPAAFVLPTTARLRLSNLRVGAGELAGAYRLQVGMVDTDQDSAALRRKMERWVRVLVELLVDAEDAGALAGFTLGAEGDLDVTYSPNLTKGSRMFGSAYVELAFFRQESRP